MWIDFKQNILGKTISYLIFLYFMIYKPYTFEKVFNKVKAFMIIHKHFRHIYYRLKVFKIFYSILYNLIYNIYVDFKI